MADPAERLLADTATAWGLPLNADQLRQFARYADELLAWNARTNLTAITDRPAIYVRHFLDSLALARFWGPPPATLADIGTGAGFPGVPLKILHPPLALTLIESVGKKTAFLTHLITTLGLTQVRVVTGRAEALGRDPGERERYDVVTARAVADLRVLAEYAMPLLRVGGLLLAPKGADVAGEVEEARRAMALLGGTIERVVPIELPGVEPRTLVVARKVAPTDPRYPRAVGIPARRPL
ncbi:MAG: 16S rRNA (guanine(527)-N(7))-methyltransferase RsmG [Oscillochloridaceae bacterium]|nr:16S rRNA (guanine(527)-N(7))-methyltransferase RsmG [Chloroflexaceae bacterium]MDW8388508.1 16S rRNA (guanine(527)-N(7))-methyltransferase RsmG [Oscillochloridaceae bacterium]